MSLSKTIVINCAGTGARLGFGHTKALLKINGKPLIIHHLEQLDTFKDVRVVVGFDAKRLIDTVLSYRRDITFVFNHKYLSTNTLQSMYLGSRFAQKYLVSLDGDLIVKPSDLRSFLKNDKEMMGYIEAYTDDPVYTTIVKRGGKKYVTDFNRTGGDYEWTGLMQVKSDKIINTGTYVYHVIQNALPIEEIRVECREVDTPNDYEKALKWAKKYLID